MRLGLPRLTEPAAFRDRGAGRYGPGRSVAIDVLRPLARIDAALGLDRVEADLADAVGRRPLPAAVASRERPGSSRPSAREPGPAQARVLPAGRGQARVRSAAPRPARVWPAWARRADRGARSTWQAARGARSTWRAARHLGRSGVGQLSRRAPPRRRLSRHSEPAPRPIRVRVLVVGDSLAADLGNRLAARLDATGRITTSLDTRPATGLTWPDASDWPTQLRADLSRLRPDVVVAMWGANDAQGMPLTPAPAAFGSVVWLSTYATRVAAVVAEVRSMGCASALGGRTGNAVGDVRHPHAPD